MSDYFISDTHFNHANIIKYCSRPFVSVEKMNEYMIQQWNNTVKDQDLVYHLGDFGWGNVSEILPKLNGKKFLIKGNHDKGCTNGPAKKFFIGQENLKVIKIEGQEIVLCHYSMQTWPNSHRQAWHLFGHSHGKVVGIGASIDVGVDATQLWRPISFQEVASKIEQKGTLDKIIIDIKKSAL